MGARLLRLKYSRLIGALLTQQVVHQGEYSYLVWPVSDNKEGAEGSVSHN